MKQQKVITRIIDVVYILGVLIVIYHLGLALFLGNHIPYPDSMLPETYLEIVVQRLAFGAIPMAIISGLFCRSHRMNKALQGVRKLVLTFLPAGICLICLVLCVVIAAAAMLTLMFH